MTTKSEPPDRTSPLAIEEGIDMELGVADAVGAENLERLRSKLSIQDQTSRLPMKQLLIVFFGLAISLLLSFLDMTSVSTALPSMAREFESASEVSWVGTSFLIANTSMQILYGRLSDVFGRKVVLISAIALFAVGNLLCGFAQSMVYIVRID
jgi:sugar phosphate permease